jgi:hypothetical protein
MPGRWLHAIARLVFDDAVRRRVVDQAIADMRDEWLTAADGAQGRMRACLRGYAAFWSLVVISPVAFRGWPGSEKSGRPLGRFASITAAIVLLLLARGTNMGIWLFQLLDRLPEGTMLALGETSRLAFLVGPVLLAAMLIRRWKADSQQFRIHAGAVVLACLASITLATFLGTAGLVGTFQGIGTQGHAGLGVINDGVVGATQPLVVAVLSGAICLAVFTIVLLVRAGRGGPADPAPRPTGRWAIGWSILLASALVAVDQLLRLHHEMTGWLVDVLGPPRPGRSGLRRHVKENGYARIGRVKAMAQPGQPVAADLRVFHSRGRRLVHRFAVSTVCRRVRANDLHAQLACSAVFVANRQNARGDGGRQRSPVSGRGQPGGRTGRRARAVIGGRDEQSVEQPALAGARQAPPVQEENRFHEAGLTHERGDVVPANPDMRLVLVHQTRPPRLHRAIMPPAALPVDGVR